MSKFVSTTRFVGDLDHEFYDDEHQRDVWNEASAIGFQLLIWASALAMAVLPWAAGETGAWIAAGLLVASGVTSLLTLAYARSRRVDVQAQSKPVQPRAIAIAALYIVAAAGYFFQLYSSPDSPIGIDLTTAMTAICGGLTGAGAMAYFVHRSRKRQRILDAIDEDL